MALNKAQMLALLADNTSGDISAQDMRDIITGVVTLEDEWIGDRDAIDFTDVTGSEPAWKKGQVYFSDGKLNVNTAYSGVTLQVGEEQHIQVINNTGVEIAEGKPVRYTVIAAGLPAVELSQADSFSNARCMGVTTMAIAAGQTGLVTSYGLVRDIDLSAFNNGDTLYLSETVAGEYVVTAPDIATRAGFVYSNDAITGSIFVAPEAHTSLPTVLAYMKQGQIAGTTLDATFIPIANYAPDGNVAMEYDPVVGSITTPSTGKYSLGINFSALFDAIGNNEGNITIRLHGTVHGDIDIPVSIPRNNATASTYPTVKFDANTGEVFNLSIACATDNLSNFSMPLMSFDIESKHIR